MMPVKIEYTTCGCCKQVKDECIRANLADTKGRIVTVEICCACLDDLMITFTA